MAEQHLQQGDFLPTVATHAQILREMVNGKPYTKKEVDDLLILIRDQLLYAHDRYWMVRR